MANKIEKKQSLNKNKNNQKLAAVVLIIGFVIYWIINGITSNFSFFNLFTDEKWGLVYFVLISILFFATVYSVHYLAKDQGIYDKFTNPKIAISILAICLVLIASVYIYSHGIMEINQGIERLNYIDEAEIEKVISFKNLIYRNTFQKIIIFGGFTFAGAFLLISSVNKKQD